MEDDDDAVDEQDGTGDEDEGGELLCNEGPPAVAAAAPPPLQLAEDDAALEEQPGLLLTIRGTGIAGACSTRMGSSELSENRKTTKYTIKYVKSRKIQPDRLFNRAMLNITYPDLNWQVRILCLKLFFSKVFF